MTDCRINISEMASGRFHITIRFDYHCLTIFSGTCPKITTTKTSETQLLNTDKETERRKKLSESRRRFCDLKREGMKRNEQSQVEPETVTASS